MRMFLVYLQLELKKTCRKLPYFIGGAVVLAVVLGTIAFSASNMIYGDRAAGRIQIGIVLPKKDVLAEKVMYILGEMDSVQSICDMQYVDSVEQGRREMEQGRLSALLVVPDHMIEGIIDGTNTPATIIFPKSTGIEAAVFKELADSGAGILGIAQAAIYAADNLCVRHGMTDRIYQVNADLNKMFLNYSLPRHSYFNNYQVSATGDISALEFYGISAFVMFLLLCGIPASMIVKRKDKILRQKLEMMGIGSWKQTLASILSVSLLLLLAAFLTVGGVCASGYLKWSLQLLAVILLVCLAAASMIVFIYELGGNRMAGVMGIFLCTVGMMFLAGGIVPSVFLPDRVAVIAEYLPASWMMDSVRLLLTSALTPWALLKLLLGTALFYTAAVLAQRRIGGQE